MKSEVEVYVDEIGKGKVLINGEDFSNRINKIEIVAEARELTQVTITFCVAEVKVIGSAFVYHKMLTINESPSNNLEEQINTED